MKQSEMNTQQLAACLCKIAPAMERIGMEYTRLAAVRSPFLAACSCAEISEILRVLNEHMEAVRVIYPKEYSAVVQKIKETQK